MSTKDFNKAKRLAELRVLKKGYIKFQQQVRRYLYPGPKIKINEKKLKEITNSLKKVIGNAEKCSKLIKFNNTSKSNDSKIINNFYNQIFIPFWNKYSRYFNHLFLEMPGVNGCEIRGHTFIDDNDTAEWMNLEYLKNSDDLKSWWSFISQWKKFLITLKRPGWSKKRRHKIFERNVYLRQRYKEERKKGKSPNEIFSIIKEGAKRKFPDYYPKEKQSEGISEDRFDDALRTIVGSRKYDKKLKK